MGIKTGRTGQADLHPSLGEETGSRIASHKVVKELVKDVGGHRLASTPTGPTLAGPAHWAHACAAAKATGSDLDKAPLQGPNGQEKNLKKKNHIVQERNDRNDAFRELGETAGWRYSSSLVSLLPVLSLYSSSLVPVLQPRFPVETAGWSHFSSLISLLSCRPGLSFAVASAIEIWHIMFLPLVQVGFINQFRAIHVNEKGKQDIRNTT